MPSDVLVSLRNISFCYEGSDNFIFSNLNVDISSSSITAVLGDTASGKSTLLKLVSQILRPTSGQVHFDKTVSVGMSFQSLGLIDFLTVTENVLLPLQENNKKIDKNEIESLLSKLDLLSHKDLYPQSLSGGMQKRVSLARAFLQKPDFLIIDEPVAGLDPMTSESIWEIISQQFKSSGIPVLLTTYDRLKAVELSQRVVWLEEKKVKASEKTPLLLQRPDFKQFLTGKTQ